MPVRILYDNEVFYEGEVSFNSIPYETILKRYTGPIGEPAPQKRVEVYFNWGNRASETNPDNNFMEWFIDVG